MSDDLTNPEPRLGYLLLRDGHAVPLSGISPDDIKAGAKHRVPHPEAEPLRHRQTLNAIVDRLGFRGDFGTFQAEGWPEFQRFLVQNGCTHRVGLFPMDHGGCIDLYFSDYGGPRPRQLADRVFESGAAPPARVFLGYGTNWEAWDQFRFAGPQDAIATVGGPPETAASRAHDLFSRRHDLMGQWGFVDNKLVNGPVHEVVDKTYWPPGHDPDQREANLSKVRAAVLAFRAVFDARPEGWVDVLPYNERLVVLRGHDGGWDVLWRSYREEEPPQPSHVGNSNRLAVEDLPSRLMSESDLQRAVHFRQEVWEEREAHEAEQAFYDRGGSAQARRMTSNAEVRAAWLREQGRMPVPERVRWEGALPAGFRIVVVQGRRVAMSDLVDVAAFRRMLVETGYAARRSNGNEPWERANEGAAPDVPVGASWVDAQAFCAWKERQLGVALRLPTREELRELRPAFSKHYDSMANLDFPWENYPPRPRVGQDGQKDGGVVPSAVDWSEPRFLEPGPELPEYPSSSGLSSKSRKRWIADFPPCAAWKNELPRAEHSGLEFIDAWDAYEWCQEWGWISGRYWEGHIGPDSWGAYKNVKVTFRVVLDLEG